ncbi:alpha-L-rhamnosidase C-terminal domain-containing protein [Sphingomonas glacialis]|uniref:Alpha-L-rhamnosidase C-terminal domain-containing protein n=1 Tax=Sphingomonas glacialis TaxID=658225 RepID=A0A502FG92_9SPHN|nr:alpha-L-rhamnosidase C-terminal domain-containing protein [Sphingomonas glacialis]TPG48316.1 hypothetical protein EAH76_21180 [Sphingomonas glacialis]
MKRAAPASGADYDSVRGRISKRWARQGDSVFTLDVTLPPNMRGGVHMPLASGTRVLKEGRPLTGRAGMHIVSSDASKAVIAIGSGQYGFSTA